MDSGAFSELSRHGKWTVSATAYARDVRRYRDEVGKLAWAAPQDWMCEPHIVAATGLSVREHQIRTVDNLVELRAIAPDLPIVPVLQGWTLGDYLRCMEIYRQRGIDLRREPLVGLGSVCRRQATDEIGEIVQTLASHGIRLHGFGVKTAGLRRYGRYLASADSLAWSFRGRYAGACQHRTQGPRQPQSEANCRSYALEWRRTVLHTTEPKQRH